jgi:hypothetical protein
VLHQAILAGVISDHGHDAPRKKTIAQCWKRALETRQFIVDGDSKGLKEPSKVGRSRPWSKRAANRADEIVAHSENSVRPSTHHFARESMRPMLVTVLAEDRSQRVLVE